MRVGYQASHEQFPPSELLRHAQAAERAGFAFVNSSDHFHPWSEEQGQAGHAWSWLGAAMHATSLPFGVVTAPVQRYHPAVIAQASATLAEMYPGRLWVSLGSGELLNEGITGEEWPRHAVRHARLRASADTIRRLWAGETVSHEGLVRVREARLFTLPAEPPMLLCAALSEETAEDAGSWADGLLTTARSHEELAKVVAAFRRGGGEGKLLALKADIVWGEDEAVALEEARAQWRASILGRELIEDLRTPAEFDAASKHVRAEDMRGAVRIGSPEQHAEWLRADEALGFERVIIHNVAREQERFIAEFGERVLGELG